MLTLCPLATPRYVGTLHEINSETSTVALEQVTSHGTEGRRGGEGEIAGSENVYEYIVFRGSDVKDLRIEEPAQKKPQMPPPQLDDPAILGVGSSPPCVMWGIACCGFCLHISSETCCTASTLGWS